MRDLRLSILEFYCYLLELLNTKLVKNLMAFN